MFLLSFLAISILILIISLTRKKKDIHFFLDIIKKEALMLGGLRIFFSQSRRFSQKIEKMQSLISFILSRYITFLLVSFFWNYFVYNQQYVLLDYLNLNPSFYKPSYSIFSLVLDLKDNPVQMAFFILSFLDSRTFISLWISKLWLLSVSALNLSSFVVILLQGKQGLYLNLITLYKTDTINFYYLTSALFIPILIYIIRANKKTTYTKENHIHILLDEGDNSLLDFILHTSVDIEKSLENIEHNSDEDETVIVGDVVDFEKQDETVIVGDVVEKKEIIKNNESEFDKVFDNENN